MPRGLHLDLEEMTEEKLSALFPRCSPKTPGSSKNLPGETKSNRPEVKNMKLSTNQNSPSNNRQQHCDLPRPGDNREDLMSHSDPYRHIYTNANHPGNSANFPSGLPKEGGVDETSNSGARRQYGYVPDTLLDSSQRYSRFLIPPSPLSLVSCCIACIFILFSLYLFMFAC
eukprot:TRINITY_DN12180_c0_g1_i2.p1 TRINITY_DN12180_c0_g1~~TRINITY_DN12180_c0_g1_i2.p1  ORF type:complete len:171 (+),score=18.03 TRINITY_DN12180_c0_g1_i2:190-702(+)